MDEKKAKIIDKIQKILLKAKSTEGTPEGDTFKRHAALMMAKYRIKETEIDLETNHLVMDKFEFWADGERHPQWVSNIVSTFCHLFDTKSVFRTYSDSREWEIIGTFSDVETSIYFIEVVCNHIEKEAKKTWPQKTYSGKREQFGNVASSVIWQRSWDLKKEMDQTIHEDKSCTALVVKKTDMIKDAIEEMYPNMRKPRGKKANMPNDRKTINAGIAAGESAPMNFAIEE